MSKSKLDWVKNVCECECRGLWRAKQKDARLTERVSFFGVIFF